MTDDPCCGADASNSIAADSGQRIDEIFTALADIRRRYVLYCLRAETRASLTDIVAQVAAWEHETSVDDIPDESLESLKIELYHNHLPTLRESSVIEYDERSEQLVYRDPPALVERCLEHCADQDLPR